MQKGAYLYEYINTWKKFNEKSLPEKGDITGADYVHTKWVCKDFEIKNLGKYHDLYVRSNTLLLADVFEKFINMWLKIYKLDPAKTFSALGLP